MIQSMMAAGPNMAAWVIAFISLLSHHICTSASPCLDGTYKHEGRDCCSCGIGRRVVEHCTKNLTVGICEECEHEKYSSEPNNQKFCERCTSCSELNANLEEDEPCTPARDRKCRCIKDHYCSSYIGICRLCQLCKKCANGIKIPCTGNNDTVCNEKIEGNPTGPIVGGIIGSIGCLVLIGLAVFCWKKRKTQRMPVANGNADVELQLLNDVDIQPHLPDIADVLGWKDMRDVANRRGTSFTSIDAITLNHPGDSQEQTFQLLKTWVEAEGRGAGKTLVEVLQNRGKKDKAQKVADILCHGK